MSVKITNQVRVSFLKEKIQQDKTWALRALLKIYEYQTQEEQQQESTNDANGVGFSGCDAKFLSSIAKQYIKKGFLSERQFSSVMKITPKYSGQILRISDVDKLDAIISKLLN